MYKVIEEVIVKVEEIASKFSFLVPTFLHFIVLNPWIWVKDNIENIVSGVEAIVSYALKLAEAAKERFPTQNAFVTKHGAAALEKTRQNAKAIERRGEQTVEMLHTTYQDGKKKVTLVYEEGKTKVSEVIEEGKNKVNEVIQDGKAKVTEVIQESKNKVNGVYQDGVNRVTEVYEDGVHRVVEIEKNVIHPTAIKVAAQSKPYILKAIEIAEPTISMAKPVWEPIADKVVEVNACAVNTSYVGPVIAKAEAVLVETVGRVMQYCNVELSQ